MDQLKQIAPDIQTLTTPIPANQVNQAFGYTNALLDSVAELGQPLLHFWTMTPTVIMGLKDKHLPHLAAAIRAVQAHGYDVVLRNSGGLAVVADNGVLNVSLFVPLTQPISVSTAYEQMTTLVTLAWPELSIDHYEITRSYCPGDYDLSVDGRKIAGIAQRRSTNALVTMLYLSVRGNQQQRGIIVRDFYQAGLANEPNQWDFPDVDPGTMTTTAALLNQDLTLTAAQDRFTTAFTQAGTRVGRGKITAMLGTPAFQIRLDRATDQMRRRQPKLN
ncbi:lipoate-protein ligase A [Levilactobacillus senmaizukei DSM 21775 = NBRC 103853]|uniref:Lipoate-protein ligase A n=1 Tax=Levilactobacillus senmaizukei DSM 21775 = NBRC 103853 TaxID=1423803 RepID=A0A0R2DBU6_9LACO|nr:lipoate--protein ligase family protein [Levilactobacillus senmaizukei]KRN01294.1 lipoate-protein ligase A [Levilactobacillus senmaizukei DSM 21775 = NBRC 103853]